MKRFTAFAVIAIILALLCSCATSTGTDNLPRKQITVSLGRSSATVLPDGKLEFSPTFRNTDTTPALIWTSSNPEILEVKDGTAVARNTTKEDVTVTITASLEDNPSMKSTCNVTVMSPYRVRFLTAGPGQDASTQAVISWHSPNPTSTLEYADAFDPDFSKSITLTGTPTVSEWADFDCIYRYKVTLTDLVPDRQYRYRVVVKDDVRSPEGTFRTAKHNDPVFSFAWLSDVHAGSETALKNVRELLKLFSDKTTIDFCLFTGDLINQGKRYGYWDSWTQSGLLLQTSYAFVIGNHEYYPYTGPDNATDSYYLDFAAIPDNHGDSASSDFWFNYGDVLFICLDTMAAEFSDEDGRNPVLEKQAEWLGEVVKANEGSFRYIIVAQHYAFLDAGEEGTGYYSFWYPVFDEYGVDLALSSDTHSYSRSDILFNDRESDSGTVYLTSPITEGKELSEITNTLTGEEKRAEFFSGGTVTGGIYFTVTTEQITMHLIGKDGNEYDTLTIPARR